ncbi:hypothetical protein QOZ80_7AG0558190 [Eleusine coracana subsp. coracana]|nr:hypothetical protein QOZ80_7AG0558190 [Eleusine coracana subsp. coracana]
MADIAFGSVESIVKIALAIKDAVQTVKQNQKECSDIEKCVTRCSFLLQRLEVKTGITKDEAMRYPLKDVAESLEDALQLVVKCQRKHYVSHLWKAADMAKELRRVQEDIVRKLQMGDFATNVHNTIMLTNIHNNAGAPLPPARPPLEASALSDDTIPDEVVPGFSQFSYSYLKAATKNFREIIGEGGTSEVYKGILHDGQVVAIKNVHRIGVRIKRKHFQPCDRGYMAPEYLGGGISSLKSDVYAFGVVLLQTIGSMRRSTLPDSTIIDGWRVKGALDAGRIKELFRLAVVDESQLMEIKRCIKVGLQCAHSDRHERPTMADVL